MLCSELLIKDFGMKIEKYIRTECGLEKYNKLKKNNGTLAHIRLYWFLFIATIRDRLLKL
ncbi:MAG: hypothetical protein CL568_01820 [Alphaproteobacteria bacterium]|jgi:hypothetical protein|nr:hypothetical protein [Alphaproteobacteria bacterium]PPR13389.1 MAG: hypothetical protein CFH42_01139 [Alphaproteobacteria bacterium MarineAlpha12_Bin1]|tara:strand:+ start:3260 stop:3439 length:180 start_codon:yes stop_codon:yes gene_type:complete